jgi:hypothetical protein
MTLAPPLQGKVFQCNPPTRRVWLRVASSGWAIPAELSPMTEAHLAQARATWSLGFYHRQQLGIQDEDLLWDWQANWRDLLAKPGETRGYVVTRGDKVQGLLLLQRAVRTSRLSLGAPLVYVQSLATAPWNRRRGDWPGRLRRTGTVLLAQAVRESLEAGSEGRVGLHSLSGSDAFYRQIGFHDLGPDPLVRGLTYFELAPPGGEE